MDRIDRRLLAIFQLDTRRTAESIGAIVGLSAAAVQRRLKRLRADGVVVAEVAMLDNRAIGAPITCVVTVSLAKTAAQLERFTRSIRGEPAVQQCYHVTGSTDLVLIVVTPSMEDYAAFARAWFETEHVARYETHVVLRRVKVGLSLPIPGAADAWAGFPVQPVSSTSISGEASSGVVQPEADLSSSTTRRPLRARHV